MPLKSVVVLHGSIYFSLFVLFVSFIFMAGSCHGKPIPASFKKEQVSASAKSFNFIIRRNIDKQNLKIFKKGFEYYRNGMYKAAAAQFWLYCLKGGLLNDYALYFQGISFIKLKEYARARFILFKLAINYPNFTLYDNDIFYLAISEYKTGYYRNSISHFKYVLDNPGTNPELFRPSGMLKLSKIYIRFKDFRIARHYIKYIYIYYPYFFKTRNVKLLINQATESLRFSLSNKEMLRRDLDLYYDGYFIESLNSLNKIKELSGPDIKEADVIRLKCFLYLKSEKFTGYIDYLAGQHIITRSEREGFEITYNYIKGNNAKTLNIINSIIKYSGRLDKNELAIYKKLAMDIALKDIKQGKYASAKRILGRLTTVDDSIIKNDVPPMFWYGIVLKKLGLKKQASFYFGLIKDSGGLMYSYYGIMSRSELKRIGNEYKNNSTGTSVIERNLAANKTGGIFRLKKYLPRFRELLADNPRLREKYYKLTAFFYAGLTPLENIEIEEMLRYFSRLKHTERARLSVKGFIYSLSYVLNKKGNYEFSMNICSYLLKSGRPSRDKIIYSPEYLRLLYPRPYYKYVLSYSNRYKIPVNLIYAIMRQESMYDPECRSVSDAIGLMQIIPPTGYYIAGRIGCKEFNPLMLYNKNLNIKFGSFYLKTLLNRFNDRKYLAIASYNAGPNKVAHWKYHRLKGVGKLIFIDSIPLGETREYVKKVLANYYMYKAIYEKNY